MNHETSPIPGAAAAPSAKAYWRSLEHLADTPEFRDWVERRFPHPKFKKVVTGYKKLYAHDEKSEAKVGDRVRIEETRPLSKTKRWRLVEVVDRASGVVPVAS